MMAAAKILAIETSTEACSVALLASDKIIERFVIAPRQHGRLVFNMVKSLLAEAGFDLADVDAIAYGKGPGSFTGVRIAAGVMQGLAFGANLPVLSVSSLQAMAQTAYDEFVVDKILVALDARMYEVYWGEYRLSESDLVVAAGNDIVCRPEVVPIPEDASWLAVGSGWQEYQEVLRGRLGDKLLEIKSDYYPHASAVAKLGAAGFLRGEAIKADEAMPMYLRTGV